ncbi:MAG: phytanoyl-CoA dioxygenase family protein [Lysobacter sp.]
MKWEGQLSSAKTAEFQREGILVLPAYYDVETDIVPIQRGIHRLIGQVMKRHGIADTRRSFAPEHFDDGYQSLIALDRGFGGEIYDAVKQLPAFIRLLGNPNHERLFIELRAGAIPGIAGGGYGIRIDNPNEERFRAQWHQEYPSQLRSIDGLVFWSPLLKITPELGPVQFCRGSHIAGPLPVLTKVEVDKSGAYAVRLKDEAQVLARYEKVAPLTSPGDLVIVDFLTIHASGVNTSQRSRWSLQFRYFNFDDPTGLTHGWKGSFAAGVDFKQIHPELCAD